LIVNGLDTVSFPIPGPQLRNPLQPRAWRYPHPSSDDSGLMDRTSPRSIPLREWHYVPGLVAQLGEEGQPADRNVVEGTAPAAAHPALDVVVGRGARGSAGP